MLDEAQLDRLIGVLGPEALADAIASLPDEAEQSLQAIRDADAKGDTAEVYRAAHALKGMAGNFAARRVADIADEIEARAKAGRPAAERLAELERAVAATRAAIAARGRPE